MPASAEVARSHEGSRGAVVVGLHAETYPPRIFGIIL
jgi:hypothetical protein